MDFSTQFATRPLLEVDSIGRIANKYGVCEERTSFGSRSKYVFRIQVFPNGVIIDFTKKMSVELPF